VSLLVLGADGFIGRHLMAAHADIATVLGVQPLAAPPGLDIRDAPAVAKLVRDVAPRFVVHLAAVSFVPDSVADPGATYDINFRGTLNVLDALQACGFAGRMVFASSAEVYGAVGEAALPIVEIQPFAPRSPYGVSKAAGELACAQRARQGVLDVCVVRPFNVIGPGQSDKFAVSSFAHQIAALEREGGGTLAVGNLDVTRDFVAVEDAVAALLAVLAQGRKGEAYNIASGVETCLDALLDTLVGFARKPVDIRVDPARVRPSEQRRVCGSHAKLSAATGWRPRADLAATLRGVIDYWRGEVTAARR
jgi:GDP-4-dehydro-6-deoxy-D-mannose reductase